MTSIKDVAREVHMSTATVSRALRGLPRVSEDTRERVAEAAVRLGYVASPHAVGLVSGQTHTVAVVVPFVTRWFFGSVIHGAERVLRDHGYDLLLYNLAGDPAARHRVFQTALLPKRVDAVLLLALTPTPEERVWLERFDCPVAVVGADVEGWRSVRIDDERAARTAVDHLISLGHRRIGYIGGSLETALDFTAPKGRVDGYRKALAAAGITREPVLETDGEFTVAGGIAAGRALLDRADRPTAVFAASDEMAFGVLYAARQLGLDVPGDVSVVGLDDHELAELFGLTTVAQPVHEQGRIAAVQVLEAIGRTDDLEPVPHRVTLDTVLVVRTSTAPPFR